ncbi:MAG: hypothetical protein FJ278_10015, partial [Planctomycetes bacterium]|nr:hypothetical protein [Planctomycetota bacterium]
MSTPPEPAPRDLDRPFPLKDQVETILACCRDAPCEPTGITRELYLDLAERIARGVAKFQESAQLEAPTCWGPSRTSSGLRSAGEIVDPVEGLPSYQRLVTGRFAGAVGMLLEAGRAKDLAAKGVKAMTLAIEALSQTGKPNPIVCAEFFPREVVSGLAGYAPYVGEETVRRWRVVLAFDPESGYHDTLAHKPLEAIFNWNSFGLVSEQLKTLHGIGGDAGFIERYLPRHRTLFDANGMYRDPNCPMTYDAVVRQNFSVMLHAGYNGSHRAWMEEALRRGALAALLFQSPTGEAPFGGRSNQFHLVEATHAGCWEFQARQAARGRIPHMRMCGIPRFQPPRTAAEGDCALAGVFKRAARRAAMSTRRWILEADPFRHQKSFFAPGTHGVDSGGNYTMYGITAAALFCHAYRLADESIGECATPAEVGGFVVESSPDFHKVFATCAGAHIEIDTRADLAKDATGIGRFHYESLRARPAEGTSAELFNSAILPITKKPVFFEKTGFWPSAACRGEQTKDGGARMAELFNS